MTLRPYNLITQQVERMRNLNYLFSGAKLNIFFQTAKLLGKNIFSPFMAFVPKKNIAGICGFSVFMVKAITLGRESYHFTILKLSFLTVKAMLSQHKKVRHGSKKESKRTFFAFILIFQKTPTLKIAVYCHTVAFHPHDGIIFHRHRDSRSE